MPTSVLPDVFTETPTFGTLTGAGGCGVTMPVKPAPPAAAAPAFSELKSAIPLVTAGVRIAGLTYAPDTTPFTKEEFRKVPMGFPSVPSKKLRIPLSELVGSVAAFVAELVAAESGEVSCCNDDGTVEISCDSCDCAADPVLVLVACATAEDCRA